MDGLDLDLIVPLGTRRRSEPKRFSHEEEVKSRVARNPKTPLALPARSPSPFQSQGHSASRNKAEPKSVKHTKTSSKKSKQTVLNGRIDKPNGFPDGKGPRRANKDCQPGPEFDAGRRGKLFEPKAAFPKTSKKRDRQKIKGISVQFPRSNGRKSLNDMEGMGEADLIPIVFSSESDSEDESMDMVISDSTSNGARPAIHTEQQLLDLQVEPPHGSGGDFIEDDDISGPNGTLSQLLGMVYPNRPLYLNSGFFYREGMVNQQEPEPATPVQLSELSAAETEESTSPVPIPSETQSFCAEQPLLSIFLDEAEQTEPTPEKHTEASENKCLNPTSPASDEMSRTSLGSIELPCSDSKCSNELHLAEQEPSAGFSANKQDSELSAAERRAEMARQRQAYKNLWRQKTPLPGGKGTKVSASPLSCQIPVRLPFPMEPGAHAGVMKEIGIVKQEDFRLPYELFFERAKEEYIRNLRLTGERRTATEALGEFVLIKKNIYLHRKEHSWRDDTDQLVCNCEVPQDPAHWGCGEGCVNRAVFQECVSQLCPNGKRCGNQRLQKRQFAKVRLINTFKKGWGIEAAHFITKGSLIGEYTGEVMTEEMCKERMELTKDEKHKYFMTLGNSEAIDASRKGSILRFCNHSCEPNCETQKWTIGGERRIGLFALTDIEKGTEITFDYQFERCGAEEVQCLCNTPSCKGVLGGGKKESDKENDPNRPFEEYANLCSRACDPFTNITELPFFGEKAAEQAEGLVIRLCMQAGRIYRKELQVIKRTRFILLRNVSSGYKTGFVRLQPNHVPTLRNIDAPEYRRKLVRRLYRAEDFIQQTKEAGEDSSQLEVQKKVLELQLHSFRQRNPLKATEVEEEIPRPPTFRRRRLVPHIPEQLPEVDPDEDVAMRMLRAIKSIKSRLPAFLWNSLNPGTQRYMIEREIEALTRLGHMGHGASEGEDDLSLTPARMQSEEPAPSSETAALEPEHSGEALVAPAADESRTTLPEVPTTATSPSMLYAPPVPEEPDTVSQTSPPTALPQLPAVTSTASQVYTPSPLLVADTTKPSNLASRAPNPTPQIHSHIYNQEYVNFPQTVANYPQLGQIHDPWLWNNPPPRWEWIGPPPGFGGWEHQPQHFVQQQQFYAQWYAPPEPSGYNGPALLEEPLLYAPFVPAPAVPTATLTTWAVGSTTAVLSIKTEEGQDETLQESIETKPGENQSPNEPSSKQAETEGLLAPKEHQGNGLPDKSEEGLNGHIQRRNVNKTPDKRTQRKLLQKKARLKQESERRHKSCPFLDEPNDGPSENAKKSPELSGASSPEESKCTWRQQTYSASDYVELLEMEERRQFEKEQQRLQRRKEKKIRKALAKKYTAQFSSDSDTEQTQVPVGAQDDVSEGDQSSNEEDIAFPSILPPPLLIPSRSASPSLEVKHGADEVHQNSEDAAAIPTCKVAEKLCEQVVEEVVVDPGDVLNNTSPVETDTTPQITTTPELVDKHPASPEITVSAQSIISESVQSNPQEMQAIPLESEPQDVGETANVSVEVHRLIQQESEATTPISVSQEAPMTLFNPFASYLAPYEDLEEPIISIPFDPVEEGSTAAEPATQEHLGGESAENLHDVRKRSRNPDEDPSMLALVPESSPGQNSSQGFGTSAVVLEPAPEVDNPTEEGSSFRIPKKKKTAKETAPQVLQPSMPSPVPSRQGSTASPPDTQPAVSGTPAQWRNSLAQKRPRPDTSLQYSERQCPPPPLPQPLPLYQYPAPLIPPGACQEPTYVQPPVTMMGPAIITTLIPVYHTPAALPFVPPLPIGVMPPLPPMPLPPPPPLQPMPTVPPTTTPWPAPPVRRMHPPATPAAHHMVPLSSRRPPHQSEPELLVETAMQATSAQISIESVQTDDVVLVISGKISDICSGLASVQKCFKRLPSSSREPSYGIITEQFEFVGAKWPNVKALMEEFRVIVCTSNKSLNEGYRKGIIVGEDSSVCMAFLRFCPEFGVTRVRLKLALPSSPDPPVPEEPQQQEASGSKAFIPCQPRIAGRMQTCPLSYEHILTQWFDAFSVELNRDLGRNESEGLEFIVTGGRRGLGRPVSFLRSWVEAEEECIRYERIASAEELPSYDRAQLYMYGSGEAEKVNSSKGKVVANGLQVLLPTSSNIDAACSAPGGGNKTGNNQSSASKVYFAC